MVSSRFCRIRFPASCGERASPTAMADRLRAGAVAALAVAAAAVVVAAVRRPAPDLPRCEAAAARDDTLGAGNGCDAVHAPSPPASRPQRTAVRADDGAQPGRSSPDPAVAALDDALVARLVDAAVEELRSGCGGRCFVLAYADGSTEIGGIDCMPRHQAALDIVREALMRAEGTAAADVWLGRDGTLRVDCIDRYGTIREVRAPLPEPNPRAAGR